MEQINVLFLKMQVGGNIGELLFTLVIYLLIPANGTIFYGI